MSIWRLVLTQTYHGVIMNSVHHYTCPTDDDPLLPGALAAEFQTQWQNAYAGLQNVDVSFESIYVRHVSEPSQWALQSISGNGTQGSTSTGLPAAWALGFTGYVASSVIRHSYKRVSGLDRVMITDGLLSSSYVSACDVFRAKMIAVLNHTGFAFTPVSARYLHEPPSTLVTTGTIVAAAFKALTTQRSRLS